MAEQQALGKILLSALNVEEEHEGDKVLNAQPADRNAAACSQTSPRVDYRKHSVADLLQSWQERLRHTSNPSSQFTPPSAPLHHPGSAEPNARRVHKPFTPPQSMRPAAPSRALHLRTTTTSGPHRDLRFNDVDSDVDKKPPALHVLSAQTRRERGRGGGTAKDKVGSVSPRSASSHSVVSSPDSARTGSVSGGVSPSGEASVESRRRCRPQLSPTALRQRVKYVKPGATGTRAGAVSERRPESALPARTATPSPRDLDADARATAATLTAVTASALAALRSVTASPASCSPTSTRVMSEYDVYDFGSLGSWGGNGQLSGLAMEADTIHSSSISGSTTPVQREAASATWVTSRATDHPGSASGSGESGSRPMRLVRKMSSSSSYEVTSLQRRLSSNLDISVEDAQREVCTPVVVASVAKGTDSAPRATTPMPRSAVHDTVVKAAGAQGGERDVLNAETDKGEDTDDEATESDDDDEGEKAMTDEDDENEGGMTPLPDSGIVLKPAKDAKPTVDPVTRWRMSLRPTHVHTALHERRLIPLDYFRKFYIPERFVEEDEWCVTYLVRERGTSRRLYAKFIRMEPDLASSMGGTSGDKAEATATGLVDALGTPLPCLSAISIRRCAMLLAMQHPHLLRCRDVFIASEADSDNVMAAFNECVDLLHPPQRSEGQRSSDALAKPRSSFGRAAAFLSQYASGNLKHKSFTLSKDKERNLDSHDSMTGTEAPSIETALPPPTLVVFDASQLGRIRRGVTVMAATDHHNITTAPVATASPRHPQQHPSVTDFAKSNSTTQERSRQRWLQRGPKDTMTHRDDEDEATQPSASHKSFLPSIVTPSKGRQDTHRSAAPTSSVGITGMPNGTLNNSPALNASSGAVVMLAADPGRSGDGGGAVVSERQAKLDFLQFMLESGAVAAVLVFECYDGAVPASLAATVTRNNGLPEDDVARCVRTMCEALCYLHRLKSGFSIAHCGVRMANLLRTSKQGKRLTVVLKTDLPIYHLTHRDRRHSSLGRHRSSHRHLRHAPESATSRRLTSDEAMRLSNHSLHRRGGDEGSGTLLSQSSLVVEDDSVDDDDGDEDAERPVRWFTVAESGDAPPAAMRGGRGSTPTLLALLRPRQADAFLAPEVALTRSQSKSSLLDGPSEAPPQQKSSGRRSFLRRLSASFSQRQFARLGRPSRAERHRGLCAADMWAVGVTMYFLLYAAYPVFRDASGEAVPESRLTSFSGRRPVLDTHLHLAIQPPSEDALDLLLRLLEIKPRRRITAEAALAHPFLSTRVV